MLFRIGTRQMIFVTVFLLICTTKMLGLLPFHLHRNPLRITRYRCPFLHPTCFVLFLIVFMLHSYSVVIPNTQLHYESDAISLCMIIVLVSYSLTLVLTFSTLYTKLSTIEAIFADCVVIKQAIDQLQIRIVEPEWWLVLLFMVNFLVNPMLQLTISFLRLVYLDVHASEHYFDILMLSYPNTITSLVPCMLYSVLFGVCFTLRLLNDEIREIMKSTGDLKTATRFRIQKRLCELSDRLDAIAQVHLEVLLVAQKINDMLMMNLVMWITFKACAVLMTIYTCYTYCMSWAFFEKFEMPIQVLSLGIGSGFVTLMEILMFVHMSSMTMSEVSTCMIKH